MPTHTIAPGQTKKIISADRPEDAEYRVHVSGAPVQIAHNRDHVEKWGDTVQSGDRPILSELRGEPVHAYNPDATADAVVRVSKVGFDINFLPRYVLGAVQTNGGNEAAPANDAYVEYTDEQVDVSAAPPTHTFDVPDAAEVVAVACDDADGAYHAEVSWMTTDGSESVVVKFDDDNSADYAGDGTGTNDVAVATQVFGERVRVRIVDDSGASNLLDYKVYAR